MIKRHWLWSIILLAFFALWTHLIQVVDIQPVGIMGTNIGFAAFNTWFHRLTGIHMPLYLVTDWLGLVPVCLCLVFATVGMMQWLQRKSLLKVDSDLLILGGYYVLVIFCYLAFEQIPINYRPVCIDGRMEASYPSSTALLVLSVMPTVVFQARHRLKNEVFKRGITWLSMAFSVSMVIGRLISGVHWFTDIIGSVLLSAGLFSLYTALCLSCRKEKT